MEKCSSKPNSNVLKMKTHNLLILDNYFQDIKKGIKNFEIRKKNSKYSIGDVLVLENIKNGEVISKQIEYITDASIYNINNIIIIGLKQKTMKQTNLFFDGKISEYFNGNKNLYLGDKDFVFADTFVNIQAEIKTISKNGKFTGKKVSFNQAREYASNVDNKDNLGRLNKSYLFEYHKYANNSYVIVIPFIKPIGTEKTAKDFLNLKKAKMMYITKENQFNKWLSGDRYIGVYPKKELLTI
tara:strand:+ start:1175 stop:1897 length:723 start_codon:yes stop_codon:yes gene_type:complete